jgi:penicillin amidase
VIGAGEPALPGISIGHNEAVAFGLTIFAIDQEDLYVYETNPQNPSEYKYKGRWEPMEIKTETIAVQDQEPVTTQLMFTRHGPVIYEDPKKHVAFAVRAAWLEPGMAPYLGSVDYMQAKNWDEFLAAMNRWGAPSENQVYADTSGNIGWKPGGLTPIRPNWDGLLPVPGDGRYEWAGFRDMDQLPVEHNPDRGWVASANQMNLPDDYPYQDYKLGFEWSAPYRYQRIAEVLKMSSNISLNDMLKLQTDHVSLPARRIIAQLEGLKSSDPKIAKGLELLKGWDGNESVNSSPAALFEVWFRQYLGKALMAKLVTPEALKAVGSGDSRVVLDMIENPGKYLGENGVAVRNEAMLASLGEAMDKVTQLLGPDTAKWAWGKLHHAAMEHPLSDVVDESTRKKLNVGPMPRGGSNDTVGNTSYRDSDFRQTAGSSWRMVLDVGNWDNSLAMNTPGQSGDPSSPHYKDLFPMWAQDEAFPLLYSRNKIEQAAEKRIELVPGK